MKRFLGAFVAAVAVSACVSEQASANGGFGFGVGVGVNFNFSAWRNPCPPPCAAPCAPYGPLGYGPACAPGLAYTGTPAHAGNALAGYYPNYGYPTSGGADLGVMRPEMAGLAFAPAPTLGVSPVLVAGPAYGYFPAMNPQAYQAATAQAYGYSPNQAVPAWAPPAAAPVAPQAPLLPKKALAAAE